MNENNVNKKEIQIKMNIIGKTRDMFLELKEYYNIGYNTELIKLLVKKVYDDVIVPLKKKDG